MMKAFIARENGMRTGRLMSQVAFVENPFYHKLLASPIPLLTQSPIWPRKSRFWRMPWRYSTAWGGVPQGGRAGGGGTLNPKLQGEHRRPGPEKMYQQGEITGVSWRARFPLTCPLSLGRPKSRATTARWRGDADLLICPDLVSGSMMAR